MNVQKLIDNIKEQADVLSDIYEDAAECKTFEAMSYMGRTEEMQLFLKKISESMNDAVMQFDVENGNDF
jgi:biotin synthase-related radical SAM superfamily protein